MKLVLKKTKLRSFFKKLALLAVIILPVSVNAQNFEWAKGIGGTGDDIGYSITTDGAGNVYTTGYFLGTVDFDPGVGTFNLISAGGSDVFIYKLDALGNFVWAKQMGGINVDNGMSIVTDGAGNIYTTGYFQGTVDFDPGAGTFNLTTTGGFDVFISKLDASGNFVWAKKLGGTNYDISYSIAIDGTGNVYTTGYFQGTVDFDPGAGTLNLTSTGFNDIFISKLNSSGNFVWAKKMGGTSDEQGNSIEIDGAGNVYTTGIFTGTADFNPGAGTVNLTSAGGSDIFISKLDASGNFVWAKQMGASSTDRSFSIGIDGTGNIYTTGSFNGTVDFDPGAGTANLTSAGGSDIYISKVDASGNFVWVKQIGGTDYDEGKSITIDGVGNIYTTGYFNLTADFDPGAGIFDLTTAGGYDIFNCKLDASGNFIWAKQMGGMGNDVGNSIATNGTGNLYTTGYFNSTADFNPGAGTFNLTSTGSTEDIFVLKLASCVNNSGTAVISACNSYTWIDGNTYTASNSTATHTLSNVGGCDSIVTLNLTIKNSNTGTDVISACNSHTWINGITYTVSNSTATHTLSNVAGCDSIVTLNLTIKNSNTGTDVISACNSHTWIDGITYTASNSTATKTLTNVAGCDSIVTLNLTIKNSNTGTDVISACNSYTWIDGITYTVSNSTATKTLTNVAGCDSIVTLNLTIKNSTTGTDVISACNSHTWIDGITYTVSNSTATKTLTNVAGCDSIVTLNLTINSSPTLTFAISADIVCATDGTLALTASPSGGIFSGQGVTGNMFDPAAATSSSYVFITYSYTDGNTCSNTAMDSIYVSGCVGLKNYSINHDVKIYPNPTEGNITIDLGTSESSVKLVVKNELGQLVSQTTYSTTSIINYNLQEKAGIYFIEITTDSGNTNHYKLIKH